MRFRVFAEARAQGTRAPAGVATSQSGEYSVIINYESSFIFHLLFIFVKMVCLYPISYGNIEAGLLREAEHL